MTLDYVLTPAEIAYCQRVMCAGDHEAKYHTFAVMEKLIAEGVPGDVAECGVMAGAHPAIMLYVLRKHGVRDRKVHLFDSFQGIPRATEHDYRHVQEAYGLFNGKMETTGISANSVRTTIANLRQWEDVYDPALVVIHEGWFEETMARDAATIGSLAFLRVDVDLYQSTKTVYRHLYPKVVSGGFVCDDDYGIHEGMTACRTALEEEIGPQDVIPVDGQRTTSWWRKR